MRAGSTKVGVFIRVFSFALIALLTSCAGSKGIKHIEDNAVIHCMVKIGNDEKAFDFNVIHRVPELELNYHMVADTGFKGKITISSSAMEAADEQDNFWGGGEKYFENKTSLWVSHRVFASIENRDTVYMPFRLGFTFTEAYYQVVSKDTMQISVNGKVRELEVFYLEDTGNKGYKYWIWNNWSDPLILKMDAGWEFRVIGFDSK